MPPAPAMFSTTTGCPGDAAQARRQRAGHGIDRRSCGQRRPCGWACPMRRTARWPGPWGATAQRPAAAAGRASGACWVGCFFIVVLLVSFFSVGKAASQLLKRHELTGDGAGRHGGGAGQPDAAGAATAWKIAVDRADGHLVGTLRAAWAAVAAGPTGGLEHACAHAFEGIEVAGSGAIGRARRWCQTAGTAARRGPPSGRARQPSAAPGGSAQNPRAFRR